MKKTKSIKAKTTNVKKSAAKKKAKSKLITKSKTPATPIHNTSGGEMPDPATRTRPLRKDVRYGFR